MDFLRRIFGRGNPAQNSITGTVTLTAALGDATGRSMNIQAYVYDGESKESVEGRIDIFQEVIERQKLRCEIPVLEATVEQRLKGLEQAREVLADLEKKRQNGDRLTSQELNNVMNLRVNIKKQDEDISKGLEKIAEAKHKAGVG